MTLDELLSPQPPARAIPGARAEVRRRLVESGARLVVVDDDPTGGQTIHDAPVLMGWSVPELRAALQRDEPVLFLSANSRSLNPEEAAALGREIGRNVAEAAAERVPVALASRSDSTLRGHFPGEVDALMAGSKYHYDGVLLAPAFFEAGRYTVDDVQWVQQGESVVPAGETEFARDPAFAYRSSNLRAWVEEKTGGAVVAGRVRSLSLACIRNGGPDAVAAELLQAREGVPVVVNAACYEDLDAVALGLIAAEERGKRFLYRCSASFVKARGGFANRPLLSRADLRPAAGPGLVVVGSYVERTSQQVAHLLASGRAAGAEVCVERLLDEGSCASEVRHAADWVDACLQEGKHALLYTTRGRAPVPAEQFLDAGKRIAGGLCEVVRRIRSSPGYLIAKGGVTSVVLARSALETREARVLGQILPGVPVWSLGEGSRWPGIPYVVFPGNVGGEDALTRAVSILQG